MASSKDIAEAAGVSPATVSRVVHGSDRVAEATRDRVLAVMQELGYRPNAAARNLRNQRTGTIGIVVSDITNPFYPQLLEALTAALAEAGQQMVLWNSVHPGEASAVTALRERSIDGLIFTTTVKGSAPLEEALGAGEPVLLLNRTIEGAPCDQVGTANVEGLRAVAEYLVRHGHRRIAYIAGPPLPSTSRERREGFVGRLAELGYAVPPELLASGDYSHSSGREAIRQLLSLPYPPTAVACANDVVAFGALSGARSLGRRVPEDLWVVGYDDIPMAGWETFDLTSVRQPIKEMAQAAVAMLLERIEDRERQPRFRRFTTSLVVRASTAHAPPQQDGERPQPGRLPPSLAGGAAATREPAEPDRLRPGQRLRWPKRRGRPSP